jgi:hypothetical protein
MLPCPPSPAIWEGIDHVMFTLKLGCVTEALPSLTIQLPYADF